MKPRAYITYFDQRYLAKAIVMIRSLRRADPVSIHYCLCLDDEAREVIDGLGEPNVRTLSLAEIHTFEPRLLDCVDRPRWAFYATHKPVLPLYLMHIAPELESVIHIDADTCFYSSMEPFFAEMAGVSIGLSPHRFPPRLNDLRQYGNYNAGFIFWRNDADARACLEEYREECLDWCWPDVMPDGRFMNQGYLNKWPATYHNVAVIRHPGLNVAYWNAESHAFTRQGGDILVDGQLLIFYHFSHLYFCPDGVWRTADKNLERNWDFIVRELIDPYLAEIEEVQRWLDATWPDLAPVDLPEGWPIYVQVRPPPSPSRMDAAQIAANLQAAVQHHQQGRIEQAEATYRAVLAVDPRNFDALQLLATAAAQRSRAAEAVDLYHRALAIAPGNPGVLANLGAVLVGLGRHDDATAILERAVQAAPGQPFILNNLGVALTRLGRAREALVHFDAALTGSPKSADIHANRAAALAALGRHVEAETAASLALNAQPHLYAALTARGFARNNLRRYADALVDLDAALTLAPSDADTLVNRAIALLGLNRPQEAAESAARALVFSPDHAKALAHHAEALAVSVGDDATFAVELQQARALAHRAGVCLDLRRPGEALDLCLRAHGVAPGLPQIAGLKWQAMHDLSMLDELDAARDEVVARIRRGEAEILPFSALLLPDPAIQKLAITNWTKRQAIVSAETPPVNPASGRALRVGYFSADFRNHAVMALMAGVFEAHDRTHVEPLAFSFGVPARDEMRARAEAAFGRIADVGALDDEAALELVRRAGLDIAVDLTGHTGEGRPALFARRLAPVQVSYLGFTGTMGMDAYDYLFADEICIPANMRQHHSEKVVWLPGCYQPNDRKRPIATPRLTRAQCGLPEDGFVYCCFNNSHKIAPDVFALWMDILQRTPGAVLWLFADRDEAEVNLRRAAVASGLAPGRLVFARRTPRLEDHFSRYLLADLFLDTSPYNAHTTASDALWSGLPVLTCIGETFAARVAASLLDAVGLSDLIVRTPADYVAAAVALAADRSRIGDLKDTLIAARATSALFDTSGFTRKLESAFRAVHARAEAGLPPAHIERLDV